MAGFILRMKMLYCLPVSNYKGLENLLKTIFVWGFFVVIFLVLRMSLDVTILISF